MTGREPHDPHGSTRRRFLDWFLATSIGALLASALYPVVRLVTPPPVPEAATNQVDAGFVDDPELLDTGFKILRFGAEPVILIRVQERDFRAFSATCTHLACIVAYRKERSLIWCYCHDGIYDLTGKNIGGPPPRPLTPYAVHVVPGNRGPTSWWWRRHEASPMVVGALDAGRKPGRGRTRGGTP